MISICRPSDPALGFVRGLGLDVDCGVRAFAQGAFDALTRPPSPFPALVSGVLTLYVALLGWGLLNGRGPRMADAPLVAVRVGVVLAMTQSWPLFQALVFRVAFDGPAELAQAMTGFGFGRGDEGLLTALQSAYDQLAASAAFYGAQAGPQPEILQGGVALASESLWLCALVLLGGGLGVGLVAKVMLGLLIVLGPLFIALAMVDATRGLFFGWVRSLAAVATADLAAALATAFLMANLQPRLHTLADLRQAGSVDLSVIMSIVGLIIVVSVAQLGLVIVAMIAAAGFQPGRGPEASLGSSTPAPATAAERAAPDRAAALANAMRITSLTASPALVGQIGPSRSIDDLAGTAAHRATASNLSAHSRADGAPRRGGFRFQRRGMAR